MSTTKFPLTQTTLFSPAPNSEAVFSPEQSPADELRGARGALMAIALCLPFWAVVAWWVFAS